MALLNFGDALTVSDLSKSSFHLDYAGRDPEAPWRTEAEARIEQYRKGDLEVRVVDVNGQTVEGAQVDIEMRKHAFGFGTAVRVPLMTRTDPEAQTYQQRLKDLTGDGRSFNYAVIENGLKWLPWEGLVPWFTNTRQQTIEVVSTLRQLGMQVRGHNLVWPAWEHLPEELEQNQNDVAFVRQRIEAHIQEEVGFDGLQGELAEWDVLNEPAHLFDLANVFGPETVHQEYANWFNLTADTASNTALYINDFNIIMRGGTDLNSQDAYKELVEKIQNAGGQIDGIGIQGHMQPPVTSPEIVFAILDEFAELAPEVSITEYDLINAPDDLDADYLRDLLTVAFSHPAVNSFMMWGFWDSAHWLGEAPLFDADWNLKPSGQAYLDLVFDTWWTEEQVQTNVDGIATARGFLGTYEIKATHEQVTASEEVTFTRDGAGIEIVLDQPTSIKDVGKRPEDYVLADNYPNPFNPATTIRYGLPEPANVKLTVYDLLGRQTAVLVDKRQQAGWHTVEFDGRNLSSGIYLYRLQTKEFEKVGRMLLLK